MSQVEHDALPQNVATRTATQELESGVIRIVPLNEEALTARMDEAMSLVRTIHGMGAEYNEYDLTARMRGDVQLDEAMWQYSQAIIDSKTGRMRTILLACPFSLTDSLVRTAAEQHGVVLNGQRMHICELASAQAAGRNRGYATLAMSHLFEQATSDGIQVATLVTETDPANQSALDYYENRGFLEYQRETRVLSGVGSEILRLYHLTDSAYPLN